MGDYCTTDSKLVNFHSTRLVDDIITHMTTSGTMTQIIIVMKYGIG